MKVSDLISVLQGIENQDSDILVQHNNDGMAEYFKICCIHESVNDPKALFVIATDAEIAAAKERLIKRGYEVQNDTLG
jgi:hypothetical protein